MVDTVPGVYNTVYIFCKLYSIFGSDSAIVGTVQGVDIL